MVNLTIIGAGAFGREVLSLIEVINEKKSTFDIIGFIDDNLPIGTIIQNKKIIGNSNNLHELKNTAFVIAIANPKIKRLIFEKVIAFKGSVPNLIHPEAKIDKYIETNWNEIQGTIICSGVTISCNVKLGNNNLINTNSILTHDTILGNHNIIMQNCVLNGEIEIKNECFLGIGTIINGKHVINNNSIFDIGSIVI